MQRIDALLRSEAATLFVLVVALLAQMPHAADVFAIMDGGEGWLAIAHAGAFAVALELAVLLFVVRGETAISWGFAGISVLMNLSHYYLNGTQFLTVTAAPAILISVSLPLAIVLYSHSIARERNPATGATDATPVATTVAKPQKTQPAPAQRPTAGTKKIVTPRQPEILRLIGEGVETRAAIAKVLKVNPATIGRDIRDMQAAGVSVNGFGGK
ncbi:MAG: hypothetical protein KAZ26_23515 [Caldilineaceae bacterium]|nr:hypothetical protein [Caldilineaceae bacterium]